MLDILSRVVSWGNTIVWSYALVYMLLGLGLYFTFKTRFVQFRFITDMIQLLGEKVVSSVSGQDNSGQVSSFQAFCVSIASRVGTGNLAGVAIAITVGGPGAVFWMWLVALIGAASGFIESTLAQIYKVKDEDGNYRGGPAYYMDQALNQKWMGILFSFLLTFSFGLVFNAVQANTISYAFQEAFGINRLGVGIALVVFVSVIIFGGVKRIAKTVEKIVPVMAVGYLIIALFIVLKNISAVPSVLALIFNNAFGLQEAVGGGLGATIMMGIKRGLFSNEAGMGSAPNAAATAEVTHPVKQGLVQTLAVFTDTILICSATAFVIIISGAYTQSGISGIQLTQTALTTTVGNWADIFIALAILLFAFSSILGNYVYGETNIKFGNISNNWLLVYRIAVLGMVLFGSVAKISIVWSMADLSMGLMAFVNLIAITFLAPIAAKALKDYAQQKRRGEDPVFNRESIKDTTEVECWEQTDESSIGI
ncbi:alanine/glycine:cation symporter family protein [Sporohalobacter salinus]|uniref:alanine/glycine:cation symporter family protein n=1 Tax=Sporohalobacter salinus TaxID=1494606 RepID=UPI0019607784|nr:alanine/glycine:cation symporter family protein [Sporohalobacter salinus]MBM7624850.1 AGCS family alanine or glycine:cation symporter [Sporohalobacter salinus]